ncbi:MAG: hypothetical protein GY787_31455 [Alteromonadales bacterium]|nr:hypothetical protein [Alteromonadales bacterium]
MAQLNIIAEFYISKELSVDNVNQYQSQFGSYFLPVYAAILDNDLKSWFSRW